MRSYPEVIIVGAGPSGLTAALQLAAYGIRFRIFDQKKTFSENSRAVGIQARSLELFEQMGLIKQVLAKGNKAFGLDFHTTIRVLQLNIFRAGQGETAYPYVFLLEQNETEKILAGHLNESGHEIEWDTEVVGVELHNGELRVQVRSKGKEETVRARWLIAADGAGSFIRETLDVPFVGGTYEQNFAVVDVKALEGDLEQDHVNLNFNKSGFVLLLPLAAKGVYRLVTNFPPDFEDGEPQFEDVQRQVAKVFPGGLRVTEPEWYSNFRIQSRSVRRFSHGPVFFVGDAAHIHSPVGAQGMNTGIQDSYNLAWKLALVAKNALPQQALETYHQERFPVAQRLLSTTDRVFQLVTRQNYLLTRLRVYVFPYLLKLLITLPTLRQWAFRTISQIGIRYDEGLLVRDDGRGFPKNAPRPGQRLPYVYFAQSGKKLSGITLFDYRRHHLMLFAQNQERRRQAVETAAEIEQEFSGLVESHVVTNESAGESAAGNHLVCDRKTWSMFAATSAASYLVRPDSCIAFRLPSISADELKRTLSLYLRKAG